MKVAVTVVSFTTAMLLTAIAGVPATFTLEIPVRPVPSGSHSPQCQPCPALERWH